MKRAFILMCSIALTSPGQARPAPDWMLKPLTMPVRLQTIPSGIQLSNGLLSRSFRTTPNLAAVDFRNLSTDTTLLRGVKPEASVTIDGVRFEVGGLKGQPDYGYLKPEWLDTMTSNPEAFQYDSYSTSQPEPRFPWKRSRHGEDRPWPPPGLRLNLHFKPPAAAPLRGITVDVHYELYQGLPVLSKWLTITNGSGHAIALDRFENEILAVVEAESSVEQTSVRKPWIHVESDYMFGGSTLQTADHTTHWDPDPDYTSQVTYNLNGPYLLVSRPPVGPAAHLAPGEHFETFRTFELLYDSDDRERQGLAIRKMYRALAPWVTENPILMHLTRSDSASIRAAVDQCAAVGFEMVILSFGSGFDLERQDPAYRSRVKADVDYAHSKGIEIGGYTLTSSRSVDLKDQVIDPATGRPGAIFGQAPCLASDWSDGYFARLRAFIEATGLDAVENDGSYPGDLCASTMHAHHHGANDSQWVQWKTITSFYQWCRARGMYLNVPDYYMLSGSNKTAMGYRETNWSLPRDRQLILGRQNIYDGSWEKLPSMGWMFVPLVEYQGGGAAATLEPLREHLDAYAAHLAQNFGSGVQACYRGPRLFDSGETRAVVTKWVDFYKSHRAILDSDIIHVRRADGRSLDCMMHVNPALPQKALAMIYNPTDREVRQPVRLPLYYAGLTDTALVRQENGRRRKYPLDRDYHITVPVSVPAHGETWLIIE